MINEINKITDYGQTKNFKSRNSLVNYQIPIRSAPNRHTNLYQRSLEGTVIRFQSITLHYIWKDPVYFNALD